MPIRVRTRGSTQKTERFAKKMATEDILKVLSSAGQIGVDALAAATPTDSGVTAGSWSYETLQRGSRFVMHWTNDNIIDGFPVVIGLQFGHGTGTGGYVVGQDFINPAMRPIFQELAEKVWREVTSA